MTYSLVARDPATGECGVAVQSHWFSVGSVVSWAEPGVGAVATQSVAEPAYGPRLLARLRAGDEPGAALAALLAEDAAARYRQVGVAAAAGGVAVHTGTDCIAHAGDVALDHASFQANMMAAPGVPEAMAAAWEAAAGAPDLAGRLLAALKGAEGAGGDVRGRQSAALVVVGPEGEPWRRKVELRVEDHPDPVAELERLLVLRRAYDEATRGDDLTGEGRTQEAGAAYGRAAELAPDAVELRFWAGLARAAAGDVDGGAALVRGCIAAHAGWRDLLERLAPEIAPGAAPVRDRLGEALGS